MGWCASRVPSRRRPHKPCIQKTKIGKMFMTAGRSFGGTEHIFLQGPGYQGDGKSLLFPCTSRIPPQLLRICREVKHMFRHGLPLLLKHIYMISNHPFSSVCISLFSNLAYAPDSPHLVDAAEGAFARKLCRPHLDSPRLTGPETGSATDGPCLRGARLLPLGLKPACRLYSLN